MTRYFTLQQAEGLLPEVESAIREAISLKAELQESEAAQQSFTQRVTMMGGVDVNRGQFIQQRSRREVAALRLKEVLEGILKIGCHVKDLDIGLIDFPTLYRGEEVYLCWKLGENGIQFWHKVEDGFQGRKAIDRDFMDNHKGETTN